MRSLQLRPISTSHYYTSGDVTIHVGVAIAPGVLLQAEPNSQIVIQSGVCIGIGAILHACNGTIEIEAGASIGAEALLVGQVHIGGNACIGAATTIINSTISPGAIIPPGSLIGDTSPCAPSQAIAEASPDSETTGEPVPLPSKPIQPQPLQSEQFRPEPQHPELQATDTVFYPEPIAPGAPSAPPPADITSAPPPADITSLADAQPSPTDSEINPNVNVYGRVFVNRMFVKMFPHHAPNQASDRPDTPHQDPWDD